MSQMAQSESGTRWRVDRGKSDNAAPATVADPRAVAALNLEKRAAFARDRVAAMADYEADRSAVYANAARLRALRLARDAAATPTKRAAKKIAPGRV